MWIEIFLFSITVFLGYKLFGYDYAYFKRRNLKYRTFEYSLLGLAKVIFGRVDAIGFCSHFYDAVPNERIFGLFEVIANRYIIRDAEIVRKICIKDFDYFGDHFGFLSEDVDKLFGNGLLMMRGQKWRQMRATLSPAFTGSKMRQMFGLISDCAENVIEHLKKRQEAGSKLDFEMKDFSTRYTNDVIASCAFGMKVDSLADPENEFYLNGKKLTDLAGPLPILKILLISCLPKLAKFFNIQFIQTFGFRKLVLDTMDYRKANNISRPDMVNIMMQVRDGSLKPEENSKISAEGFKIGDGSDSGKTSTNRVWTEDEIVAQCFIFFFAGFESTSNLLTFAAYELVVNQDVQQKLYEEVIEVNEQLNGKQIDYDTLQKMKYLDQVVSEVLRKWPPIPQTDRECIKDYVFDNENGLKFDVEKKAIFQIPTYGIHHDPEYYPNPKKFDPERFSEENKENIVSGSYLPFGIGPRNCIASRFALMEIKAILYHLLLNFSFEANERTDIPIKLKKAPNWAIENGMNMEFKPRPK